jgi:hypothetical protein
MGKIVNGKQQLLAFGRLDLATGKFVELPSTQLKMSWIGNAQGWVAGHISGADLGLLTDAGLVKLPDLGSTSEDAFNEVSALSDDGRTIAGQADLAEGDYQAVVWHCS